MTPLLQIITAHDGKRSEPIAISIPLFAKTLSKIVEDYHELLLQNPEASLQDRNPESDYVLVLVDDVDSLNADSPFNFSRASLLTVKNFLSLFPVKTEA